MAICDTTSASVLAGFVHEILFERLGSGCGGTAGASAGMLGLDRRRPVRAVLVHAHNTLIIRRNHLLLICVYFVNLWWALKECVMAANIDDVGVVVQHHGSSLAADLGGAGDVAVAGSGQLPKIE